MKKSIILGTSTILVIATCGVGYWNWTRSVSYSLKSVAQSVKDHDRDAVEKYADLQSISSGLIDDALEASSNGAPNQLAAGLVELMKPKLASMMKDKILSMIEGSKTSSSASQEDNQITSLTNSLNEASSGANFKGIKEIKEEGKIAFVTLEFELADGFIAYPELRMRNKGDHWQIVNVNNIMKIVGDHKQYKHDLMVEEGRTIETPSLKKVLSKLKSEKDLRAFTVLRIYVPGNFDGETQKIVEAWGHQCKSNSDYTCRLASYFFKVEGEVDLELKLLKMACDSGKDLTSCFGVAIHEKASESDKINSIKKLNEACDSNNIEACQKLGYFYIPNKVSDAKKYYSKACEKNDFESCTQLSLLLKEHSTSEDDKKLSYDLALKSCNAGEASGCTIAAYYHHDKKELDKAKVLYEKGCQGRHSYSCVGLGQILVNENNFQETSKAFGKACNLLDGASCRTLASFDKEQASSYHYKGCLYGDSESCKLIGKKIPRWLK